MLTLLPVTAYLPAILAVHLLSGSGFLPTVSVWSAGVLLSFTLLFLQRLVNLWLPHHTVGPVLAAAIVLCALAFRFLRRPYRTYVLENRSGWLLLSFPAVMLFLLFSYWANTVTDPVLLLLILLTALSLLGVMAWELAYISTLNGQLSELSPEVCCANVTVNALLRSCLSRARALGCRAEVEADVPRECPVDELDLCVILANAIENAVHACRRNENPEGRWIRVRVATHENGVMTLKIENPCEEAIAFGPDGLPKAGPSEEHGIGLKNVKAVVEQYGGIWSEEECFQAIDPDQQFYLDGNGDLVIVFGEYEVAPGSMGMPRFVSSPYKYSALTLRPEA